MVKSILYGSAWARFVCKLCCTAYWLPTTYLLDDQIEQHGLPEEITHVHDVVPISFDDELIKYMNQCTPKTVTNVLNKICQSSARLE